jgi:hypothetical protein
MPREPALSITFHGPRTSLPHRVFHPTYHVQQDISPTDNPTARRRVEIRNYLRDQAGSRSLVFDLSIAHRHGSSYQPHPLQNGRLTHPQDIDAPLRLAAQRKMNIFRQQYPDNHNISFLPAITSTSTRMHDEFLRLLR